LPAWRSTARDSDLLICLLGVYEVGRPRYKEASKEKERREGKEGRERREEKRSGRGGKGRRRTFFMIQTRVQPVHDADVCTACTCNSPDPVPPSCGRATKRRGKEGRGARRGREGRGSGVAYGHQPRELEVLALVDNVLRNSDGLMFFAATLALLLARVDLHQDTQHVALGSLARLVQLCREALAADTVCVGRCSAGPVTPSLCPVCLSLSLSCCRSVSLSLSLSLTSCAKQGGARRGGCKLLCRTASDVCVCMYVCMHTHTYLSTM